MARGSFMSIAHGSTLSHLSTSTYSDRRTRFQTISNFFLPYVTFLLLMPFRLYCIEYEEEHVERVSFHGADET